MQKINENKVNLAQDLIQRVIYSQKSVNWWEEQVCQINELEKDEEANAAEIDKLINQLSSILPRAKMELKTIDDLEDEVKSFLKNEQKEKTKQESKSPNRKENKFLSGNKRK